MRDAQVELMRHALRGGTDDEYRNYYCVTVGCSDHAAWLELCECGLARQGAFINDGRSLYFHVTDAGRAVVDAESPLSPEWEVTCAWWPDRPMVLRAATRGAARYRAALDLKECWNLDSVAEAFGLLRVRRIGTKGAR